MCICLLLFFIFFKQNFISCRVLHLLRYEVIPLFLVLTLLMVSLEFLQFSVVQLLFKGATCTPQGCPWFPSQVPSYKDKVPRPGSKADSQSEHIFNWQLIAAILWQYLLIIVRLYL